jgi:hypothetical protein
VLHIVLGQSTLPVILVLWAAYRAERRGWLWGLAIAWALTKPQAAILPTLWLLWQDRASPLRWQLLGGIAIGTLLLALPATLRDPQIWSEWLASLATYRGRVLQMAAWQWPGTVVLVLAGYLWWRSRIGGWQWWLTAAIFPHTSFYDTVVLLPVLRPRQNGWTLAGLALAGILQGPMNATTLPLILAGQLLAGWMIARPAVPRPVAAIAPAGSLDSAASMRARRDEGARE